MFGKTYFVCYLTGLGETLKSCGKNIFDSFDFISGNVLFVLTALLRHIYVGWAMKDKTIDELVMAGKSKANG